MYCEMSSPRSCFSRLSSTHLDLLPWRCFVTSSTERRVADRSAASARVRKFSTKILKHDATIPVHDGDHGIRRRAALCGRLVRTSRSTGHSGGNRRCEQDIMLWSVRLRTGLDLLYAEAVKPIPGQTLLAKHLKYEVDRAGRRVTTTWLGAFQSRAIYRDGFGCLLVRGDAPKDAEIGESPLRTDSPSAAYATPFEVLPPSPRLEAAGSRVRGAKSAAISQGESRSYSARRNPCGRTLCAGHRG
jgi:hypothetical protein